MTHLHTLEHLNPRVQIMGIVNRTPDSFFDGGQYLDDRAAHLRAEALLAEGADIIDVGAESTRPGAAIVSDAEQIARLGKLPASLAKQGVTVSIDTTSPTVARHGVAQGARMINSVSLETAGELGRVAAEADVDLVLTHCRGAMSDMAGFSRYAEDGYEDVVDDVVREWEQAAEQACAAGLARDRLVFDPGLGFAKSAAQSLELCGRLGELKARLGVRVLVGPSRKSYIAKTVSQRRGTPLPPPSERLGGTIAAVLDCVARGADVVRVHDVAAVAQALAYADALAQWAPSPLQGDGACSRG